jgi:hypothetical protein
MRPIALFAIAAGFVVPLMASAPAHAQATRTWVSGVGDDVNPCSRTAPCKTFAGAISKTAAGGEINCLDPGGFGAVTITKSMAISCEGVTAGIVVSGGNGINVSAGANDQVFLKGLDIEGLGTTTGAIGLNGIKVNTAALVHIEDCVIRNFKAAAPNGFGISVASSSASVTFTVLRSTLYNNGTGATGGGILVGPTAGAVNGTVSLVTANRNVFGLVADSTLGTTGINVTVRDSAFNRNTTAGVAAAAGAVGNSVMAMRSSFSNGGVGLQQSGAGANIRVGESQITGNNTGVTGTVLSYVTNQLNANGVDGTLTPIPGGLK